MTDWSDPNSDPVADRERIFPSDRERIFFGTEWGPWKPWRPAPLHLIVEGRMVCSGGRVGFIRFRGTGRPVSACSRCVTAWRKQHGQDGG